MNPCSCDSNLSRTLLGPEEGVSLPSSPLIITDASETASCFETTDMPTHCLSPATRLPCGRTALVPTRCTAESTCNTMASSTSWPAVTCSGCQAFRRARQRLLGPSEEGFWKLVTRRLCTLRYHSSLVTEPLLFKRSNGYCVFGHMRLSQGKNAMSKKRRSS